MLDHLQNFVRILCQVCVFFSNTIPLTLQPSGSTHNVWLNISAFYDPIAMQSIILTFKITDQSEVSGDVKFLSFSKSSLFSVYIQTLFFVKTYSLSYRIIIISYFTVPILILFLKHFVLHLCKIKVIFNIIKYNINKYNASMFSDPSTPKSSIF